jgi:hypothetical protein
MKHTNILTVCLVAALALLSACSSATTTSDAAADPVTGTWVGEWGPSPSRQTEVTVELKWDGTTLTGTVDPDRSPFELTKASFDPKTNAVRMELDGPNSRRETVHYVIDGKISGTTMSGTFDRAGEKGTFKIQKK